MEITITKITSTDIIFMVGVVVAAIGVIATIISVIFAMKALYRKNRLTSVMLVADTLKVFAADKDMQDMFFAIEYDKFKYTPEFHTSPEERKMDKMLSHLSAAALAWDNGLIRQEDIVLVQYDVIRILRNKEVQKYLHVHLGNWTQSQKLQHPYQAFIKLGEYLEKSPAM